MEMPQVIRPIPRRVDGRERFEITPTTPETVARPSSVLEPVSSDRLGGEKRPEKTPAVSRSTSILNLTSSTLLGIYSKTTSDGQRDDISTPWGTGAQTPGHKSSIDADLLAARLNNDAQQLRVALKKRKKGVSNFYLPLFLQTAMLFMSGMAFGMLVTHLQRTQQIAPLPVPSTVWRSWYYQLSWGLLGVLIGNALPLIDVMMTDEEAIMEGDFDYQKNKSRRSRSSVSSDKADYDRRSLVESGTGPLWYSTVRSVGAFVGIAFAVRRVPWQSTLQVSLTLAAANPVLWYLIDRSKSGFALSTVVGVVGTFLLLLVNPDFVPVPAIHQDKVSDRVGVYTWLASILFCTSLCFGAIGRKLHL